MTTTLLIVRHGQTAWNKDEHFRGRADLVLDETGQRQAEAVAKRLAANYQPAVVLSSPLQRTKQTATSITHHLGQIVQPETALIDLDYGEFTGLSPAEAEMRFPEFYRTWLNVPHIVRFPQGESLDEVRRRVSDLVCQITDRYPNEQVVLVTHLVVCQVLLCSLLGIHNGYFNHFQIDPASLTVCEADYQRGVLVTVNDTCHLPTTLE
jgi:broad specificity phosphatase PhoE